MIHACEVHTYEMHTYELYVPEMHAHEGFCEDLARQATATHPP
jgi:hypothetical protein